MGSNFTVHMGTSFTSPLPPYPMLISTTALSTTDSVSPSISPKARVKSGRGEAYLNATDWAEGECFAVLSQPSDLGLQSLINYILLSRTRPGKGEDGIGSYGAPSNPQSSLAAEADIGLIDVFYGAL